MRTTFRTSVFETNSSSMNTFVYVSKRTLEEWKRGTVILKEGCLYRTYGEKDFAGLDTKDGASCIGCTYEEVLSELGEEPYENEDGENVDVLWWEWGRDCEVPTHTFIRMGKSMFESWKKGETILADGRFADAEYTEDDLLRIDEKQKWKDTYAWGGTYEGMREYFSKLKGGRILKSEADREYADPEEWEAAEADDPVFQRPFMRSEDDGKNVSIHIWGLYE